MFAARQATSVLARRCVQSQQPLLRVPQLLPVSRNTAKNSFHTVPVDAPSSGLSLTNSINNNSMSTSLLNWGSRVMETIETAVWNMSSTMKKRRAKMNKHKLQKRRKLLRRKSN
jgi:hypothetical protein